MPGGLPEVSQKFSADSSGYIAGISAMIAANKELVSSIKDAQRQIGELKGLMGGLGDKRVHVEVTGVADAIRQVGELKAALDSLGDRTVHVGGDNGEMVQHLKDISTYMDMATDSMQRMEDHLVTINRNSADSSASLDQMTQMLRDNADAHHAAAAAAAANAAAQRNAGGSGGWGAAAAAAAGGAAGGGGGGYRGRGRWSSAAYAAAGGGADFPVGSAGHDASVIIGFVKRWWTPVHFAIMTANELMATMLPAAAAAGAATLVGWQGVEQMIPRFQAINQTAEALGGAYGITSGQYLGTGNAIQRYQNLATGGVYELGGAGINLARMGAGTFGQTGLNTIAMLDRGFANMQLNMQQRGTMGLLGGLAGKGTDYLQQLGGIGSNIGNIFLGLAPHLPGVGEDYLGALQGITGAASGGIGFLNQHGMGNLLGAGMAFEAGWRIGKPVVGLAGRGLGALGGLLGKIPGLGRAGLSAAEAADVAALTGVEGLAGAGGAGLAGLLGEAGLGLGMLGGPEVGLAALAAFGISKIASYKSPAQKQILGLQSNINQAGFSAAFTPLAHAIVATQQAPPVYESGAGLALHGVTVRRGARGALLGGPSTQMMSEASQGFAQTTGDLVNAGPQLVAALKKAGLKSVSMADAFQIAQNALLDTTHAFDKHGNLTKTAVQQLMNYTAAIAPMTRSGGAFNAAIGAQQVMSSPAMQDLSKVNQAMDSMIQIASGGPAGMAGLMGMIGGAHPAGKPPAVMQAMAHAMTSFTSAGGAAAWSKFAGPSGVITAEQQNLDQLRTYMTLGALGPRGAAGIAGFQLQQLLPMAKQSPAALALLMQQAAGIGIGGYYQGTGTAADQARNYAALQKALGGSAFSAGGLTQAMNQAVIRASNIPATAQQFMQGVHANIQSQQIAQASTSLHQVATTAAGGGVNMGALGSLVGAFRQQGLSIGHGLVTSIDAALKQAGVGKTMRVKIEAQVSGLDKLNAIKGKQVQAKVNVQGAAELRHLQSEIAALKSKNVRAAAQVQGAGAVAALNAEIAALHSKEVTITTRMITIGGMAGVTQGIPAGVRAPGMQTGGMVPGSGHGDIIPAMLEPGEAIIPRYLVPLIAPILAAHRVPGFGGVPQSSASHFAAGGIAGVPPVGGNVGKQFAFTLVDEITKELKSAGAQKIAQALVSKIGQEVQYAKDTASGVKSGLNLAGMDLTQGSVLGQMQNYAAASAAFGKDLGSLRKQHLAKGLISQLIAAGPVQGDLLAQSILGTGVKGVNQVWGQIGHSANIIGSQAAMAQYGGMLAPNLKSGSFTSNNVSINISAGSGATLALSEAQIKQLVAKVQAALLKQAKRNPRTGLQLSGKGA